METSYVLQAATREENRRRLLQGAVAAFAEIGYDGATTRDIVRAADLSPGTFYNHFTDKEDIFKAIMRELIGEIWQRGHAARAAARTTEEYIRSSFWAFLSSVAADRSLLKMIARNQVNIRLMRGDKDVVDLLMKTEDDLRDAMRRGTLPEFSPEIFNRVAFGAGFEIVAYLAENKKASVESAVDQLTRIFCGAVEALARS